MHWCWVAWLSFARITLHTTDMNYLAAAPGCYYGNIIRTPKKVRFFATFWHVQGPQTSAPRGHSRGMKGSTALNQSPTEHRKAKYYSNFHSWLIFLAFCCSHTLMQFTIYICKSHTSLQKELCTMNMPVIQ